MKKILFFITIFVIVFSIPCFSASSHIQTNRVVVTFSPIVINNINCTDKLFEVFSQTIKNHKEVSEKLEASGALWAISQNLCGIQICISSPKKTRRTFPINRIIFINS